MLKQVLGHLDAGFLAEGGKEGIVGEDVWVGNFVERPAGGGEEAAFGVEDHKVVGEVGGVGDV